MPSLRSVQRAFAASLAQPFDVALDRHVCADGFTSRERIEIYRNSCRGVLIGALRLTYPAVHRLVGAEFFDAAAGQFVAAHWPSTADLNEYGGEFADFLQGFAPAQSLTYLADVARFEWTLSAAAHADDAAPLEPSALADLDAASYPMLRFCPHPSMHLVSLRHPADQIADAVLAGNEAAMAELHPEAADPVRLVVHRGPGGVQAHRVDALEFELLIALRDGAGWSRIAEQAGPHASRFLAQQLVQGRIAGFNIAEVDP